MANSSDIDVDKSMLRIIADSSKTEFESRIAKGERSDAGNTDVNGIAENVHTVFGYAAGRIMQECIGLRGSVTANDIDCSTGVADSLVELVEQVEEAWIHIVIFMNTPVAEEAIELCLGRGEIVVSLTVNDV